MLIGLRCVRDWIPARAEPKQEHAHRHVPTTTTTTTKKGGREGRGKLYTLLWKGRKGRDGGEAHGEPRDLGREERETEGGVRGVW